MEPQSPALVFHDTFAKYLTEWRTTITTVNKLSSDLPPDTLPEYVAHSPETLEFLIKLSDELKLTSEAQFTVLDTFDCFAIHYFRRLFQAERDTAPEGTDNNWLADYYTKDLLLYVLIVILLVSKYFDANHRLDLPLIKSLLERCNVDKTLDEIREKEFFVFQTIGWKIRTPVAFEVMEFLLRTCLNPIVSCIDEVFKVSVVALRFVYFQRDEIYRRFVGEDRDAASAKADKILLGGAVVLAAAKLIHLSEEKAEWLLNAISDEVKYATTDLLLLSSAIVEAIME
jgi:hypothetical protein